MGSSKERAHRLALRWWAGSGSRSSAGCDKCFSRIEKGEGYLCEPSIMATGSVDRAGIVRAMDLRGSPDLLCERCFAASSAEPFKGKIPDQKKWWQFWG